jgi:hypothetical protein
MRLSPALFDWYAGFAPFLTAWIALFTVVTSARILRRRRDAKAAAHSSVLVELAALPLTLLQSICFVRALRAGDLVSAGLFLWWGPGFVATVLYVAWCASRKRKPNFFPVRRAISWLCKLNYLAFAVVFVRLGHPELLFVYSAWIINDQYGMAFLSADADRLRRTFHDRWLVRALYPLGLFAPLGPWCLEPRAAYAAYGLALFALWLAGVESVRRRGLLMRLPDDSSLWRNMMYFSRPAP